MMTTKTYILTMNETTLERVTTLLNSIPSFSSIDWDELEEIPENEQFVFTIECRKQDLRTVEKMLAPCV